MCQVVREIVRLQSSRRVCVIGLSIAIDSHPHTCHENSKLYLIHSSSSRAVKPLMMMMCVTGWISACDLDCLSNGSCGSKPTVNPLIGTCKFMREKERARVIWDCKAKQPFHFSRWKKVRVTWDSSLDCMCVRLCHSFGASTSSSYDTHTSHHHHWAIVLLHHDDEE